MIRHGPIANQSNEPEQETASNEVRTSILLRPAAVRGPRILVICPFPTRITSHTPAPNRKHCIPRKAAAGEVRPVAANRTYRSFGEKRRYSHRHAMVAASESSGRNSICRCRRAPVRASPYPYFIHCGRFIRFSSENRSCEARLVCPLRCGADTAAARQEAGSRAQRFIFGRRLRISGDRRR